MTERRFRYDGNGKTTYTDLSAQQRADQLDHLLRKSRLALDYIVAQALDTRDIHPGEEPIQIDASFTFALPGIERVYVEVSVESHADHKLVVSYGARQLQRQGGGVSMFSSIAVHHPDEIKALFASYGEYKFRADGYNSLITISV